MSGRTTIILALDCAAAACSAAVWRDGAIAARRFAAMARGQAEALVPMAQQAMAEAGLAGRAGFAALGAVAVTVGPGSFTGLRIALAAARGIRLAHGTAIVGVTSLAAVAAQVPVAERAGADVLVTLDSKRGDIFAQLFDSALRPLRPPAALAPAALPAYAGAGPLTLAGDAADSARPALEAAGIPLRRAGGSGIPDAADVAQLAARLIADNGGRAEGAGLPASPLYLRAPDVTPEVTVVAAVGADAAAAEAPIAGPAATVREVGSLDLQLLSALHAGCFAEAWSAGAMAGLLATPGTFALLALAPAGCAGLDPAGFVMARVAAEDAEVLSLGVLPAFRRRGIGRLLMARAAAGAQQRGARRLFLEVAADDAGAQQFYRAGGFLTVGRRAGYYRRPDGGRGDALVLRRQLDDWSQVGQESPVGR